VSQSVTQLEEKPKLKGQTMIIIYIFASLLGALTTLTAFSPFGWSIALVCAPVGGSAFTLVAALVVWTARAPEIAAPSPA
jgi:hypothetical protein